MVPLPTVRDELTSSADEKLVVQPRTEANLNSDLQMTIHSY